MNPILLAAIIVVALIILLWFFPVALWFQSVLSGVYVSLVQLVLMRWRGVNPNTIVMAMITGTKAGLSLKANELEAHYLAKGNVPKVVMALISANRRCRCRSTPRSSTPLRYRPWPRTESS